ncbi:MAG: hypothetical protein ACRENE_16400, partial [Polyangiaceae bacterium]
VGRFEGMDPEDGDVLSPLSLHRFIYAGDEPVDQVDPSGAEYDMESLGAAIEVDAVLSLAATVKFASLAQDLICDALEASNPANANTDACRHDVMSAYDRQHADLDAPELVYHRARARESLLVMMYFNKVKATTFGLHSEQLEQLTKYAPPEATPGTVFEADFTRMFIWFVKDYVLPDWDMQVQADPGGERGNAADTALVAVAAEKGIPLVTNEGFNKDGYDEGKIGKRARAAGVTWYHPRRYFEGKIDEHAEIADFLRRCVAEVPRYLDDLWTKRGKDKSDEVIKLIIGSYRHILLGETEGRDVPVRVRL